MRRKRPKTKVQAYKKGYAAGEKHGKAVAKAATVEKVYNKVAGEADKGDYWQRRFVDVSGQLSESLEAKSKLQSTLIDDFVAAIVRHGGR